MYFGLGYDVFGLKRFTKDELLRRTDYTYDAADRLTQVQRAARVGGSYNTKRATDSYTYDAAGNRISHTTTPDGTLLYTDKTYFDALARITKGVSAQGRTTTMTYGGRGSGLAYCLDPLEGLTPRDDGYALIAAQREYMPLVAGGDEVGAAGECCGEHVIVIGIVLNDAGHGGGRDDDGDLAQVIDEALRGHLGLHEPSGELVSGEHPEQFGQQHLARAQLEGSCQGAVDQPARQPLRDHAGNQQVRVDDDAHVGRLPQLP